MVDYAMMSRNVRAFMSLFHCSKPVVCKVHGFCVAGGTDMALCSDLLVIAADAKIGYPPARVWGSPTTSMWAYRLGPQRAKRLLFTGDSLTGTRGAGVGAGDRGAGARASSTQRTEALVERIARAAGQPAADDEAAGQPVALSPGPARHSAARAPCSTASPATRQEGYAFQQLRGARAASARRSASATSRSAISGPPRSRDDRRSLTPTRERLLRAAQELIEERAATARRRCSRSPSGRGWPRGRCTATSPPRRSCSSSCSAAVCDREVAAMQAAAERHARRRRRGRPAGDRAGDVRRAGAAPAPPGLGADRRAGRPAGRRRAARLPRALRGD